MNAVSLPLGDQQVQYMIDGRLIPVQFPYLSVLLQGRPRHGGDEFSLRHPRMERGKRAKLFAPFDALTGFSDAIDDKLARYVEKRELTEEEQEQLDRTLSQLYEQTRSRRAVVADPVVAAVTYYVPCPDEQHEAYGLRGSYETLTGPVRKVDPVLTKSLQIADTKIEFADIAEIWIVDPTEEEK